MRKYFKTDNNSAYISEWKSKGLSNEGIKPPKVGNNNLTPQINYYEHHSRVIFSGSCLQQSKIDYGNKKYVFTLFMNYEHLILILTILHYKIVYLVHLL